MSLTSVSIYDEPPSTPSTFDFTFQTTELSSNLYKYDIHSNRNSTLADTLGFGLPSLSAPVSLANLSASNPDSSFTPFTSRLNRQLSTPEYNQLALAKNSIPEPPKLLKRKSRFQEEFLEATREYDWKHELNLEIDHRDYEIDESGRPSVYCSSGGRMGVNLPFENKQDMDLERGASRESSGKSIKSRISWLPSKLVLQRYYSHFRGQIRRAYWGQRNFRSKRYEEYSLEKVSMSPSDYEIIDGALRGLEGFLFIEAIREQAPKLDIPLPTDSDLDAYFAGK